MPKTSRKGRAKAPPEPRTIADLKPAPYNPRKISEEQLERLQRSMETFGDLSGIVFNRRTGNTVGGHQRLTHLDPAAAVVITERLEEPNAQGTVALGYVEHAGERWTYREVDVDEQTEGAMNVAANKHGGEFDIPKLAEVLSELDAYSFDMDLTEFGAEELESLLASVGSPAPAAEAVDPRAEWEGMPEFAHEDKTAYQSIAVHFKDEEAVVAFAELVGQKITPQTRYLWYPEIEIERYADKSYAPES